MPENVPRPWIVPCKASDISFLEENNEEEREEFKKKIENFQEDPNVTIIYEDEVHFQQQTSVTRKWVKKGSRPKIKSAPGRQKVAYSGYVSPSTGELIVTEPEKFNYETVIQSIRVFLSLYDSKGKKIILVLDNAPWHKKAKRLIQIDALDEYADIRERLEILSLPPYSPDLNPIEQVWRKTRKEVTHNRYFKTIDSLASALNSYFHSFRSPNKELESLCSFKHKN